LTSPFELYPNVKSIAIAGIYYLPDTLKSFDINEYIKIVPKCSELEAVYLPRTDRYKSPTHYIVGLSHDERYCSSLRKISNSKEAESSIFLAYIALCLYQNYPFIIGPIFGFLSEGAPCAYVLSSPTEIGAQGEIYNDLLISQPISFANTFKPFLFDDCFIEFYRKFLQKFIGVNDQRWNLAVIKFVSGITQKFAYEAILDFAISLETLLNRGEKELISFRVSLYMALLIGINLKERKIIEKDIKDFYSLRSNLVHGSCFKLKDKDFDLIKKVGNYLNQSLKLTYNKNLKAEVYSELDYMSLLGKPSYSLETISYIITEKDIVEAILHYESLNNPEKYSAYLKESEYHLDEKELFFELTINGEIFGPYESEDYLWRIVRLKGLFNYSSWLSKDDNGSFIYIVKRMNQQGDYA
jgi:hypothetical protein